MTSPEQDSSLRAQAAAGAAADKKGTDIVLLEVGEIISIVDWFVVASASNTRQVRTIVDEVERAIAAIDESRPFSIEGREDATWVLLDYGDVVVHVFLEETRAYYDLDRLWADAGRVDWDTPVALDGS